MSSPQPSRSGSNQTLNLDLIRVEEQSNEGFCVVCELIRRKAVQEDRSASKRFKAVESTEWKLTRLIGHVRENEDPRLVLWEEREEEMEGRMG